MARLLGLRPSIHDKFSGRYARCSAFAYLTIDSVVSGHGIARASARSIVTGSMKEGYQKTALYDILEANGASMVPFAGYWMPTRFKDMGSIDSHKWVRANAGLFDVSHMKQWSISGSDSIAYLQYLTPADLAALKPYSSTLTVFTNEQGGIIDDSMVTKLADNSFYVVTNAACYEKDRDHLMTHKKNFDNLQIREISENSLIAFQGPLTSQILQGETDYDLKAMPFGHCAEMKLHGLDKPALVSRGGYTGEDGFEISLAHDAMKQLVERLISRQSQVRLIGLGARDSLRLEAGLCLYGHDLDETISPVEASLSWLIAKSRRTDGGFLGASTVLRHLNEGVERRRVGLMAQGPPARENVEIFDSCGEQLVGKVTSGLFSPTLGKNIAMAYIKTGFHKKDTALKVRVRNKLYDANIHKMPFVQTKYFKP